MAVVPTAMCSWDSLGAAAFYGAVTKYDIVIAYVGPAKAAMPAAYPGGGGRLLRPDTGAVDDNQGYSTHNGEREKCYTAPIQEETPKTVAMEVSTVIASWRSFFQMVFFIIVLLN